MRAFEGESTTFPDMLIDVIPPKDKIEVSVHASDEHTPKLLAVTRVYVKLEVQTATSAEV